MFPPAAEPLKELTVAIAVLEDVENPVVVDYFEAES